MVALHYNPSKPPESVLKPGISVPVLAALLFATATLAIAIWAVR